MKKFIKRLTLKLVYHNDRELLDNAFKRSQDYFILQAVFATIFTLLTGGVFLSGFAVYLGASDEIVSFLTIMPTICGVFLILGSVFLENIRSKKKAVITLVIISRAFLCSIVTIPLFVPEAARQIVMLVVTIISFSLQALYGVIINKWFISVVQEKIRGRYFAARQSFALCINVILPLLSGWFMDAMVDKYAGFIVLYSLGLIATAAEVYSYINIDEPAIEFIEKGKMNFFDTIRLPFKNREFINYVIILFVFFITLYFSCSFTSAYMIRYLKLPYIIINLIGVFNSILQIFLLRIWGVIGDKYGHKFVMNTSMWFYAGETFIWAIASKSSFLILIPFACIFSATANSGFAIGAFNRRYMIIPEKGRIIFDGFYSSVIGVALIIAPLLGGLVKESLSSNVFIKKSIEFGEFRVLYMITCIGIIVLQLINTVLNRNKTEKRDKKYFILH